MRADGADTLREPVATERAGDRLVVALAGAWTTTGLADLAPRLAALHGGGAREVELDLRGIAALDTNGAWAIRSAAERLGAEGAAVEYVAEPHQRTLLDAVARTPPQTAETPREPHPLLAVLARVGQQTYETGRTARDLLSFLGAVTLTLAGVARRPWRIRGRALVSQMEQTGLNALPIVGLLSFLIGIVLAYQGADQLSRFGAQIFTVNLVGIGVLREMGVLLTAIIVAGRSGSAYTAQIGTMKVNQEIDALQTLGLDPLEVLVLPRVLGLILVMPLLTFYADVMGLIGGAVMSMLALDISINQFVNQLHSAVGLNALLVGLVKAPLFAFIIAVVGCFEGMQVSQSAESVGRRTTRSVVESVFLVIVLDAMLSIFFSVVGV